MSSMPLSKKFKVYAFVRIFFFGGMIFVDLKALYQYYLMEDCTFDEIIRCSPVQPVSQERKLSFLLKPSFHKFLLFSKF